MRFACVGDNCVDRYLPPVDARFAGGNAVNVAVQLRRLGHQADYFGAIGDDADGAFLRARLAVQGVGLSGLKVRTGAATAYTDIATAANGERHFVFEEFGATRGYRPPTEDIARLLAMDHVHIGWLDDGGALKHLLRRAGVSVSQDLSVNAAPQDLMPDGLNFAFASASPEEAEALARQLLAAGALCAVVTMGGHGSLARRGSRLVRLAAEAITPLDTTGAGDSFIAGFLSTVVKGGTLRDGLAAGRARASLTCLHAGGFPQ
jgi:fructoselysine 6-kinase